MSNQSALFELAFRPMFLLGAGVSALALVIWLSVLSQWPFALSFAPGAISPVVWHAEQMIFGFAATIACGFLLTAVQNWTGLKSLSGGALIALVVLWLTARILLLLNQPQWFYLAVLAQLAWWLFFVGAFSRLLWRSRNQRNYLLAGLLAVLACLNMALLLLDHWGRSDLALHLARSAVLLFIVLMSVVGGRVIAMFTRNGLARIGLSVQIEAPKPWLERSVLLLSLVCALVYFISGLFDSMINGTSIDRTDINILFSVLFAVTGLMQLWRLSYWQSLKTLKLPLLWSLHLSYLAIGVGLLALSASYFVVSLSFSNALHIITMGAMGLMILAMISRVSLGHTGRALVASPWLAVAYLAMVLAIVTRVLLPVFQQPVWAWQSSVILWVLSMGIFLWLYTPILWAGRVDKD